MLSYSRIIELNNDFADAHYLIENFGNGERWQINDHDQDATFKYPLMWMEDLPNSASQGEYIYAFQVWFVTRVEPPKDKGAEILYAEYAKGKSDMLQCAKELVSYWVQDNDYPSMDIDKNISIETFIDTTKDNVTGCSLTIRFREAFNYNNCVIPMAGTPTAPTNEVTITINDSAFTTYGCGTTNDINVIDLADNPVGSKVGNDWVVNVSGDPVTNSMNGTGLTDAAAGTTKTFVIRYTNDDPVVVTTISDSATAFIGEVPDLPAAALNTSTLYKSGQTATQKTGDDGQIEWGRGTLFDVLDFTNPFLPHTQAYTGTTGGYAVIATGLFFDKDGNSTTEALAFPNGLVLNWKTWNQVTNDILVMDYNVINTGTPNSNIAAAPYTRGGFAGFYVANVPEIESFFHYAPLGLNWAPINFIIGGGGVIDRIQTRNSTSGTSNYSYISVFSRNTATGTTSGTVFLTNYLNVVTDFGL